MSKRHKQGRPRAGVTVDDRRAALSRRRYTARKAQLAWQRRNQRGSYGPPRPIHIPARRLRTIFHGETAIGRCLREAREAVRRALYSRSGIQPADVYGTYAHNERHRYDKAVHERFVANLKAAGIAVEGGE